MNKSKILVVVTLVILENILLWYISIFYFQHEAQETRVRSKVGQAEICRSIPVNTDFFSVLEKMDSYLPDRVYIDSKKQITLFYGSEFSRGFSQGAGVGFDFDKNYKLVSSSCEGHVES